MRLTKSQILGSKDIIVEEVATPEWAPEGLTPEEAAQCCVGIRNLTGSGRAVFIQRTIAMKKANPDAVVDAQIEMLLVAMTAVDADNKTMFTEEDVKELGERSATTLARCAAVAQKLSGLTEDAIKEAAKNSQPAQS